MSPRTRPLLTLLLLACSLWRTEALGSYLFDLTISWPFQVSWEPVVCLAPSDGPEGLQQPLVEFATQRLQVSTWAELREAVASVKAPTRLLLSATGPLTVDEPLSIATDNLVLTPADGYDANSDPAANSGLTFAPVQVDCAGAATAINITSNGGRVHIHGFEITGCSSAVTVQPADAANFEFLEDVFPAETDGATTLHSCLFHDNILGVNGGAVYAVNATVETYGCTFVNNSVSNTGNAISAYTSNLRIDWCRFVDNGLPTQAQLPAVYMGNGVVQILNSTFIDDIFGVLGVVQPVGFSRIESVNISRGPAQPSVVHSRLIDMLNINSSLCGPEPQFTIRDVNVVSAKVNYVVFATNVSISVENINILGDSQTGCIVALGTKGIFKNVQSKAATAFIKEGSVVTVKDSVFASITGQRLFWVWAQSNISLHNVSMVNNWYQQQFTGNPLSDDTVVSGSAVLIQNSACEIVSCNISNNTALAGGSIYAENSVLTLDSNVLIGSVAERDGGAVYVSDSVLTVSNCTFRNNTAGASGGSIAAYNSTVIVNASSFALDQGDGGGSIYASQGNLTVRQSSVASATADANGGGLSAENVNLLLLLACDFANNTAMLGGSLHLMLVNNATVNNCSFGSSSAGYGGGIESQASTLWLTSVRLYDNTADVGAAVTAYAGGLLQLDNCQLDNHTALLGGAIAANQLQLSITNSTLDSNTARRVFDDQQVTFITFQQAGLGGAVYTLDCTVNMTGVAVTNSTAASAGGGMLLQDSFMAAAGCSFLDNVATSGGGGALSAQWTDGVNVQALVQLQNCTFSGNSAAYGGAVAVTGSGVASLVSCGGCTFTKNVATQADGGAMAVASANVSLVNSTLINNQALMGGGGGITAVSAASLRIVNTTLAYNVAGDDGGAVDVDSVDDVTLVQLSVHHNVADTGGGIAVSGATAGVLIDGCSVASNVAGGTPSGFSLSCNDIGGGGGACIDPASAVTVRGSNFAYNSAVNGGGLYLGLCAATAGSGCSVELADSFVTDNTANQGGGGGVFVAEPDKLNVTCTLPAAAATSGSSGGLNSSSSTVVVSGGGVANASTTSLVAAVNLCGTVRGNMAVGDGSYGGALAGPPASLAVQPDNPNGTNPSGVVGPFTSGTLLDVNIVVIDDFNNTVTSGVAEDVIITAEVVTPQNDTAAAVALGPGITAPAQLHGITEVGVGSQGVAEYSHLQLLAAPGGSVQLRFQARVDGSNAPQLSQLPVVPTTLPLDVRGCSLGEIYTPTICALCLAPTWSFDVNASECQACPSGATCSGGTVVPNSGAWQSHPRSAQMHVCPLLFACVRDDAQQQRLLNFQASVSGVLDGSLLTVNATAYQAEMCADGYTGNLCGVCTATAEVEYGRGSERCVKCESRSAAWVLYMLCRAFDLLVVSLLIGVVLFGIRTKREAALAWQRNRRLQDPDGLLQPGLQQPYRPALGIGGMSGSSFRAPGAGSMTGSVPLSGPALEDTWQLAAGRMSKDESPLKDVDTPTVNGPELERRLAQLKRLGTPPPPHATAGGFTALEYKDVQAADSRGSDDERPAALPSELTALRPSSQLAVYVELLKNQAQMLSIIRFAGFAWSWPDIFDSFIGSVAFTPLTSLTWVSPDCLWRRGVGGTFFKTCVRMAISIWLPAAYVALAGVVVAVGRLVAVQRRRRHARRLRIMHATAASSAATASSTADDRTATIDSSKDVDATAVPGGSGSVVGSVTDSEDAAAAAVAGNGGLWADCRRHALVVMLVIVSYFYPSIASATLSLFACDRIDGPPQLPGEVVATIGRFWAQHSNTVCYSPAHLSFALAVGIPAIVVVVIGYPVMLAALLWRQRAAGRFRDVHYWVHYSHLYENFDDRLFFWRSVLEFSKLALVGAAVALRTSEPWLQAWVMMGVAGVLLGAQLVLLPLKMQRYNRMQACCLVAVFSTLLLGLTCIDLGDSDLAARLAVVGVVIAVNAVVLMTLVLLILHNVVGQLHRSRAGIAQWFRRVLRRL